MERHDNPLGLRCSADKTSPHRPPHAHVHLHAAVAPLTVEVKVKAGWGDVATTRRVANVGASHFSKLSDER